MRIIDRIDREILTILQGDARCSNAEIARQVDLAPSAVLERIRKLRDRGVIDGFTARLRPEAVGLSILAFVSVKTEEPLREPLVAEALSDLPEVLEVHDVAGEDCYLLKVRAKDIESLHRLLRERIGSIPAVRSTTTTIVMKTMKDTSILPLVEP